MTTVLVTGGTGALGTELVPRLVTAGHDVVVLSRKERPAIPAGARAVRGDLDTGAGLEDATASADVIAHLASGTGGLPSYRKAKRTDVEGTQRLVEAAKRNGAPHIVYISIVGIDKIPFGYYRGKLETEGVIESSGLPYTILRTTQWHTLAWEFCRRLSALPIVLLPKGVRMQLLDAGEVADRMASLVLAPAAHHVPEMGGPEALAFTDIARRFFNATGRRRLVGSIPLPGASAKAFADGHNLAPEHRDGTITWDQFLATRAGTT
jgi:uncharacterized protein YbjT (DUF2867 family)